MCVFQHLAIFNVCLYMCMRLSARMNVFLSVCAYVHVMYCMCECNVCVDVCAHTVGQGYEISRTVKNVVD